MVGDFGRGEQLARQFLALAKQYQDENVIHSYAISMGVGYYQLGRAREVLPMLETMSARYDDVPTWSVAVGLFYAELERTDDARAVLDAAAEDGFDTIPNDTLWLTSHMVLADVCWFLQDAERAEALYRIVEPHAHRHIVIGYAAGYLGSVEAVLGRLAAARGEIDLAERHLRAAIREERRVGAIPWATRSASILLRSLKRAGRPIPEDVLTTALDSAYKFEMLSVAAQLEAVR
jgi:tetratricopeptide (TPR) repeat protein